MPDEKPNDTTQAEEHDMWCICDECVEIVHEEMIEERSHAPR